MYAKWTVKDIDGNVYTTVQIGNQLWMVENLRTTTYNDNTDIPHLKTGIEWSQNTGGYCFYNNSTDDSYKKKWGALYNWHAVNTGKLAPQGWHVPTMDDFITLKDFLGGEDVAGGKMKETGTANWSPPNTDATNSSGFSALPGGMRLWNGSFDVQNSDGFWWNSSEYSEPSAWYHYIEHDGGFFRMDYWIRSDGLSVRLVRDN